MSIDLSAIPLRLLLREISNRGGNIGALGDAGLLCLTKDLDYNPDEAKKSDLTANIDRSHYFPFGATSYAQMIHTKSMRFNAVVSKGGSCANESLTDSALDIINYGAFYIDWTRRQK